MMLQTGIVLLWTVEIYDVSKVQILFEFENRVNASSFVCWPQSQSLMTSFSLHSFGFVFGLPKLHSESCNR